MNTQNLRLPLLLLFSLLSLTAMRGQDVVFNEIMQSNVDQMMVKSDFPDSWIELYNTRSRALNLKNWRIGITPDYESAWSFRNSMTIYSHDYLLVYCDQVDNGYTHTSFHLDAKKCTIYLWDAQGNLVDSLAHPKQPVPNVAYGRTSDAGDEWGFEVTPTPGAANGGVFTSQLLPDPVFSQPGCVMTEGNSAPVALTISIPDDPELPEDVTLHVTTDGSAPTIDSPSFAVGEDCQLHLSATTVVRARLFSSQALTALPVTHSYIFHPRSLTLPVFSFSTNGEYLYDEQIGMLLGSDGSGNCYKGWRRPFNIEYFEPTDYQHALINQVGEAGMHGAGSLSHKQKAMNVYTNKRWQKKRFDSSTFWPDKPQITKTKTFCVRNGGSRCLDSRMEDAFVQKLFANHIDSLQYLEYRACIVYINGVYRGLYGLRERANHTWAENNRDVEEDVTVEVESFYDDGPAYAPVKALIDNESSTYADFCRYLDMPLLLNYLCCEAFATNMLFPHSNVLMWQDPTSDDTRFHPLLKDLDDVAETANSTNWYNFITLTGKEGTWAGAFPQRRLFERLFNMPEFRDAFIDRMQVYLGDFCKPQVTLPMVQAYRDEIDSEVAATFAAIDEGATYADFDRRINQLLIPYCKNRPMIHYQHLTDRFELGSVIPLTVSRQGADGSMLPVRFNGIALTEGDFEGACYSQRNFTLALGQAGYCWCQSIRYTDGTSSRTLITSDSLSYRPNAAEVSRIASIHFAPYQLPDNPDELQLDFGPEGFLCYNPHPNAVSVSMQGNEVNINAQTDRSITYTLKGEAQHTSINLHSRKPLQLRLQGVTLSSDEGWVVRSESPVPIEVIVAEGTQNQFTCVAQNADRQQPGAALFAQGPLSLQGQGSLHISTSGKVGRCIASMSDLTLSQLQLTLNNRSVGVKETGVIWSSESLYAAGDLRIESGQYQLTSTGAGVRGIVSERDIILGNTSQPEVAPSMNIDITGTTLYATTSEGTLTVGCPALLAHGAIDIYGDTQLSASSVDNSGNGLKAETAINVHGGHNRFHCYDDCINCPGPIAFYGGTTTCFSYHDDAIDSDYPEEGAILLAGGNLFAYTVNMPTSEGIDCDDNHKILISGGIVVTAGGAQHPDKHEVGRSSQGYYLGQGVTDCDSRYYYSLLDPHGEVICTYRFEQNFTNVQSLFTAPTLPCGSFSIVYGTQPPYNYTDCIDGSFWIGGKTDNTLSYQFSTSNQSAIQTLHADPATAPRYYTPLGIPVTHPTGLFIQRQ